MKNLLVTGANGQLGRCLKPLLPSAKFVNRADLDLSSSASIQDFFGANPWFSTIINLAAYTQVDLAEKERESAWAVNALAPEAMAPFADRVIHISTDYVFDGQKKTPYLENDLAKPLSYYGESKLEGEKRLLAGPEKAIVIRTSWLYSEYASNFLTKISQLARQKPELRIVNDQHGTPTYARDLAAVIVKIAEADIRAGIYHYSNDGETTWFEFAKYFLRKQNIDTPIYPIDTAGYPLPAVRPAYGVLDKTKIKRELAGLKIAPW